MNDNLEKIRINRSHGSVTLLDFDLNQVAYRKFSSIKQRKEIMEFWNRTYKLDEKSYYIVISPN
jgi:hypothetical protein